MTAVFENVKKILVIKLRHIGDVLLTVPTLRALKGTFPGADITVLVNAGTDDVLANNPLVSNIITFDREIKTASFADRVYGELGFMKTLRAAGFDMSVDLTSGDRAALIGYLSGARYRIGRDPAGSGFKGKKYFYTHLAQTLVPRTHTVLKDLSVVKEFGIDTSDLTVDIFPSKFDEERIERMLQESGITAATPFVHVHPTSRWLFKCSADKVMAQILDLIAAAGLKIVITTGPAQAEMKRARSIISQMKSSVIDLSGRLTIKQLAVLSRSSAFFFGVDSAPMHIAAAAGARVAAIFGPSGAFDWGPWDNAAKFSGLSPYPLKSGVQRFGKNVVIQKDWDCIPCGKDGCAGTKKSRCLDELDPVEVVKALFATVAKDVLAAIPAP